MYERIFGPSSVQLHNLNLVLRQIKEKGPVSRADLARNLNCSKSTVTNIVGELIRFRLVREVGKGSSATGRKSTLLVFNPNGYFVVAADLRPGRLNLAVVDLSGNIECQLELQEGEFAPAELLPRLIAGMRSLIKRARIDRERIEAVGIMVSGVTNSLRGVVRYSAALGWEEPVELGALVGQALGLPVFIENDVNALALAESWLGCGQASDSLAYIYVDEKVGGAYIYKGSISHGADFAFAEFGKLIVSGERGAEQLEKRLAIPQLLNRFGAGAERAERAAARPAEAFDRFLDLGEAARERFYEFLIETLSQVITTIVAILDPHQIVLHCFSRDEAGFISRLTEATFKLLPRLPERTVRVVPATLLGQGEVIGAAAAAIGNTRFKFVVQG